MSMIYSESDIKQWAYHFISDLGPLVLIVPAGLWRHKRW